MPLFDAADGRVEQIRSRGRKGALAAQRALPPRREPERLLAEDDHIQQLDRCLTDEAMPLDLRVGERSSCSSGCWSAGSPSLTKDDVIEDSQATWLAIDGHRLMLPARLARLIRRLRD